MSSRVDLDARAQQAGVTKRVGQPATRSVFMGWLAQPGLRKNNDKLRYNLFSPAHSKHGDYLTPHCAVHDDSG